MVQLTARVSLPTYEWLDKQCDEHEFRSYGHAIEKMAVFYRKGHRVIGNLKSENARLRERVRLFENGQLQAVKPEGPSAAGSQSEEAE